MWQNTAEKKRCKISEDIGRYCSLIITWISLCRGKEYLRGTEIPGFFLYNYGGPN